MCFLRDSSLESAMEHYNTARSYRDMIIGIGLDSNEHNCPPTLFADIFALAKRDGFKITAHCDVGQQDTHANIHALTTIIKADRIDHGLNAADKPELVQGLLDREIGLTICPWAYFRRWTYDGIKERLDIVKKEGVKMCISSDGPPYQDDCWVLENLLLLAKMGMGRGEMLKMTRVAVGMTWASEEVKERLYQEMNEYETRL